MNVGRIRTCRRQISPSQRDNLLLPQTRGNDVVVITRRLILENSMLTIALHGRPNTVHGLTEFVVVENGELGIWMGRLG